MENAQGKINDFNYTLDQKKFIIIYTVAEMKERNSMTGVHKLAHILKGTIEISLDRYNFRYSDSFFDISITDIIIMIEKLIQCKFLKKRFIDNSNANSNATAMYVLECTKKSNIYGYKYILDIEKNLSKDPYSENYPSIRHCKKQLIKWLYSKYNKIEYQFIINGTKHNMLYYGNKIYTDYQVVNCNKLNSLETPWDQYYDFKKYHPNLISPSYQWCLDNDFIPSHIFDIAVSLNGKILYGINIKSSCNKKKLNMDQIVTMSSVSNFTILEIDINLIYGQKIRPQYLNVSRVITKYYNIVSNDILSNFKIKDYYHPIDIDLFNNLFQTLKYYNIQICNTNQKCNKKIRGSTRLCEKKAKFQYMKYDNNFMYLCGVHAHKKDYEHEKLCTTQIDFMKCKKNNTNNIISYTFSLAFGNVRTLINILSDIFDRYKGNNLCYCELKITSDDNNLKIYLCVYDSNYVWLQNLDLFEELNYARKHFPKYHYILLRNIENILTSIRPKLSRMITRLNTALLQKNFVDGTGTMHGHGHGHGHSGTDLIQILSNQIKF